MSTNNYDLLSLQIERAQKLFQQVKCPYSTTYERLSWDKHEGHWHIMLEHRPLLSAPVADRIACAMMIPGLYDQIIKAKAYALTDAGRAAEKLSIQLDFLEKQL